MIWGKVGIVAGVYLGTRLTSRQPSSKIRSLRPPEKKPRADCHALEKSDENRAQSRHPFLGASALSLATSSAGYLFFPATLGPITLALLAYSATPMLLRAERGLRRSPEGAESPRLDKDGYSALVSSVCLASGQWGAAAIYNTLYHFSEKSLNARSEAVATKSAAQYAARQKGDTNWVSRDGIEMPLPSHEIRTGEILVISAGEMIPVDGLVLSGEGSIDAIDDAGKANVASVSPGSTIPMASLLLQGRLEIKALRSGAECETRRADAIRARLIAYQPKLLGYAERWADRAALPFLAASAVTWPLFGISPAVGFLFSAPTTGNRDALAMHTANHLEWAAEGGIIFRDPRALERLARISAVVFDGPELLAADPREAAQTIVELRERGVARVILFASERSEQTERIAESAGIQETHWQADAKHKARIIERLREQGARVCCVTHYLDGLLALKNADVAVCREGAPEYLLESSDILLLGDQLGGLVRGIDSARSLPILQTAEFGAWGSFALINTLFVIFLRFSPLQSSLLCALSFALEYRQAIRPPRKLKEIAERQTQARLDAQTNVIEGTAEVVS